jgi:hypothetical protein
MSTSRTRAIASIFVRFVVSPATLFAAGEKGYWLDPSDLSTMWQDATGTIAAAVNQPVGRMLDKSGNGYVFTQATSASRPILRQDTAGFYYLEFDGVDDYLAATTNVDLSTTDKVSFFLAWTKFGETGTQRMFLGAGYGSGGGFGVFSESGSVGEPPSVAATGSSNGYVYFAPQGPGNVLVSANLDTAVAFPDEMAVRVNGAAGPLTRNAGALGTSNFGSFPQKIGCNHLAFAFAGGRLYGLVVRGALTTGNSQKGVENYLNARCGFY